MARLSETAQRWIVGLGLAFLVLRFAWFPLWEERGERRATLGAMQALVERQAGALDPDSGPLAETLERLRTELGPWWMQLRRLGSQADVVPDLLEEVRRVVSRRGASLVRTAVLAPETGERYTAFRLHVVVEGPGEAVLGLVEDLVAGSSAYALTEMQFERIDGTEGAGLRADFVVSAIVRNTPPEIDETITQEADLADQTWGLDAAGWSPEDRQRVLEVFGVGRGTGVSPGAGQPAAYETDLEIVGLVYTEAMPMVMLRAGGEEVLASAGDTVGDERVVEIRSDGVLLRRNGAETFLSILDR